jgi:hypothetical protein
MLNIKRITCLRGHPRVTRPEWSGQTGPPPPAGRARPVGPAALNAAAAGRVPAAGAPAALGWPVELPRAWPSAAYEPTMICFWTDEPRIIIGAEKIVSCAASPEF